MAAVVWCDTGRFGDISQWMIRKGVGVGVGTIKRFDNGVVVRGRGKSRLPAAQGLEGLTLTTFENVPWNAPYYARMGFVRVPEAQWSEGIRRIVEAEPAHGLDAWPRVVMGRALT